MSRQDPQSIIGQSSSLLEVLDHVSRIGSLNRPVLVIGERGTGKELIAGRLHYLSQRWDQPFLKVNCAALPETLLETELFGHEAGAFTGATGRHMGRFERADGGSLFLDEIASMSARLQEKLLRVIEYGEFERVGGTQTLQTDVRIIGAANMDLPMLAREGKFRADLLDRLAFDVITLPPLRARKDDIPLLAEQFAMDMIKELKRDYFPGFTDSTLEQLVGYAWPGNIRELKNVVERAVYQNSGNDPVDTIIFDPFASPYRISESIKQDHKATDIAESTPAQITNDISLPLNFKSHINDIEKDMLQQAMRLNRFHQRHTAESLGLSYHQLRGYLKKYSLIGNEKKA